MSTSRAAVRIAFVLVLISAFAFAQDAAKPEPAQSVEVHADRSVTFHCKAPNAKEVQLEREGLKPEAMQPEGNGWWTITTPGAAFLAPTGLA